MSNLSNQAIDDLKIFFEDFSERVYLNGIPIDIVIDLDRLQDRSKKEYDGIHVGDLLYYCKVNDFSHTPEVGEVQMLNKRSYKVFDVREDLGLYEIILKGASS